MLPYQYRKKSIFAKILENGSTTSIEVAEDWNISKNMAWKLLKNMNRCGWVRCERAISNNHTICVFTPSTKLERDFESYPGYR